MFIGFLFELQKVCQNGNRAGKKTLKVLKPRQDQWKISAEVKLYTSCDGCKAVQYIGIFTLVAPCSSLNNLARALCYKNNCNRMVSTITQFSPESEST